MVATFRRKRLKLSDYLIQFGGLGNNNKEAVDSDVLGAHSKYQAEQDFKNKQGQKEQAEYKARKEADAIYEEEKAKENEINNLINLREHQSVLQINAIAEGNLEF